MMKLQDALTQKHLMKNVGLMILAATVTSLTMNFFISPANLVPAGFSGMSLLIIRIGRAFFNIELNYSVLYLLFNIPVVILAFKEIGGHFTILSVAYIIVYTFLVQIFPKGAISSDPLLLAIFGGILNGVGNSLILHGNACGGGTDFLVIFFAKKYQKSMWKYSLMLNVCIISISGILFGWDIAMYSIIYQFVSNQVISYLDNRYKRDCFFIVTEKPDEIMDAIYHQFNHSCTELQGMGSFTHEEKKMLYVVVGQYETRQLISIIHQIDEKAFVNVFTSQQIIGNFYSKSFY